MILLLVTGMPGSGKSTWIQQLSAPMRFVWQYWGQKPELVDRLNSCFHQEHHRLQQQQPPKIVSLSLNGIDYNQIFAPLKQRGEVYTKFEDVKHLPYKNWPHKYKQQLPEGATVDFGSLSGPKGNYADGNWTLQQLYQANRHDSINVIRGLVQNPMFQRNRPDLMMCDDFNGQLEQLDQIVALLKAAGWPVDTVITAMVHYDLEAGRISPGEIWLAPKCPLDLVVTTNEDVVDKFKVIMPQFSEFRRL